MSSEKLGGSCEMEKQVFNGWMMLLVTFGALFGGIALIIDSVRAGAGRRGSRHPGEHRHHAGVFHVATQ